MISTLLSTKPQKSKTINKLQLNQTRMHSLMKMILRKALISMILTHLSTKPPKSKTMNKLQLNQTLIHSLMKMTVI